LTAVMPRRNAEAHDVSVSLKQCASNDRAAEGGPASHPSARSALTVLPHLRRDRALGFSGGHQ